MARLQILELPEGAGDDRAPFILVVDEYEPRRYTMGPDQDQQPVSEFEGVAEKIGARSVLIFAETVDIPANDATAYLRDSGTKTELDLKLGGQDVREAIAADIQKMREANEDRILDSRQARLDAQRLVDERTDMDRLAKWKNELTDALGVDRLRDWDDIRNAATGMRKQLDSQAAELERLRAGEEAVTERGVVPTPAQWIWQWNRATPEKRHNMAAQILDGMHRANNCVTLDHEGQLADLQAEVGRLHTERAAASKPDG